MLCASHPSAQHSWLGLLYGNDFANIIFILQVVNKWKTWNHVHVPIISCYFWVLGLTRKELSLLQTINQKQNNPFKPILVSEQPYSLYDRRGQLRLHQQGKLPNQVMVTNRNGLKPTSRLCTRSCSAAAELTIELWTNSAFHYPHLQYNLCKISKVFSFYYALKTN